MIEVHPAYFMQVRVLADMQRAKREGKMGIIVFFESAEILEGNGSNYSARCPWSTLQETPRDVSCRTRGQDGSVREAISDVVPTATVIGCWSALSDDFRTFLLLALIVMN